MLAKLRSLWTAIVAEWRFLFADETPPPAVDNGPRPCCKQRLTGRGEPCTGRCPAPTADRLPDGQHADHWILSDEERARGFVRPVRLSYVHDRCGGATYMPRPIAETYAARPGFYGSTFCCHCHDYFPVGADGEFRWEDGTRVGS